MLMDQNWCQSTLGDVAKIYIFIIGLNETILEDSTLTLCLLFIKTISIDALVCISIDWIKL